MIRWVYGVLVAGLLAGCGPLVSDPDALPERSGPPVVGVDARNLRTELRRTPVAVGDEVPFLILTDQLGNDVSTVELTTSQDTVMIFLPPMDSPAVRPAVQWVRQNRDLVKTRGAEVVLVTPTPPEVNGPLAKAEDLHVAVLSDPSGWGARAFGLAHRSSTSGVNRPWTVIAGREGRVYAAQSGLMEVTEVIQTLAVRPTGEDGGVFDLIK
ncbi:redoxin domain-containing protein [bacterium]|nr:redoxin domain-containing protein [bacterium]